MNKKINSFLYLIIMVLSLSFFSSCFSTKNVAYLEDIKDSVRILSKAGQEPIIKKKDILSIYVTSLSSEATLIFNAPNIPVNPAGVSNLNAPQTAGYLVNQSGTIKFPILGELAAEGLTQKELESNITQLLIAKKLLFDPIVTIRYLNFRVTVLGEVARPGVVNVPSEQINIFEALGEAGDLTIYGVRDNVILIRQEEDEKIVKRLNLNSSKLLTSPYYFLKSNDILYVEPGKSKIIGSDATLNILPVVFSGVSVIVIVLNTLLK